MAIARCLTEHAPKEGHDRSYARPLKHRTCSVAGCERPAVLWLNPEEAKEHERGTRIFWEPDTFATMRAADDGLSLAPPVPVRRQLALILQGLAKRLASGQAKPLAGETRAEA
jgi:hypothetical protein